MYALQYVLHSLFGGGYYNMRVPNTDSKVHDRLWVAVAALILGTLCDEGQGPCVDLLRVVGVLCSLIWVQEGYS